ncbi:hypothetical protein CPB85DRAFT_1259065 [Mucidula mucida]|nr:hypothetical protein CPB85DRAFT_1259065 [Mucidula mucida]
MNTRAALVVSLVSGILTSAYFLRPIRVVRAQGPSSSLYWTEYFAIWDTGDPTDEQGFEKLLVASTRWYHAILSEFAKVGELVRYGHAFVECIEDIIPEIGPLFDSMKDGESEEQPTAAAALSRYNKICSSLCEEDMEREVAAVRWTDGSATCTYAVNIRGSFNDQSYAGESKQDQFAAAYHDIPLSDCGYPTPADVEVSFMKALHSNDPLSDVDVALFTREIFSPAAKKLSSLDEDIRRLQISLDELIFMRVCHGFDVLKKSESLHPLPMLRKAVSLSASSPLTFFYCADTFYPEMPKAEADDVRCFQIAPRLTKVTLQDEMTEGIYLHCTSFYLDLKWYFEDGPEAFDRLHYLHQCPNLVELRVVHTLPGEDEWSQSRGLAPADPPKSTKPSELYIDPIDDSDEILEHLELEYVSWKNHYNTTLILLLSHLATTPTVTPNLGPGHTRSGVAVPWCQDSLHWSGIQRLRGKPIYCIEKIEVSLRLPVELRGAVVSTNSGAC